MKIYEDTQTNMLQSNVCEVSIDFYIASVVLEGNTLENTSNFVALYCKCKKVEYQ